MNLVIKPISHKFKMLYQRARYKVLFGGRGSGKSWAIAEALIYYAIKYPGMRILCTREVQKSIKESSYQLLVDTARRLGVSDRCEFIRDTIRIDNGSVFIFTGLSTTTEQSLKSFEGVDICWVEEAQVISQSSLDILIPTIRKKNSQIWFSFNPFLPTDPISQMFLGDTVPPSTIVTMVNYDDNPLISSDLLRDIEHMKQTDPKRYQHIYRGGFADDGDTKVFSLESVRAAIRREPEHVDGPVIGSVDVARYGDDSSVLTLKQGNRIYGIQEWQGKSITELADLVSNEVMNNSIVKLVVDGSGLGAGLVDVLKQKIGNICDIIEFNGAFKANDTRYANARAETLYQLKDWMQTGQIPNNSRLVSELISIEYKFSPNNATLIEKKEDYKKRMGVSPDFLDSAAMLFYTQANSRKLDIKKLKSRSHSTWT